jgi:hypothetical protein
VDRYEIEELFRLMYDLIGLCVSMLTGWLLAGKRYSIGQAVSDSSYLHALRNLTLPVRRCNNHGRYRPRNSICSPSQNPSASVQDPKCKHLTGIPIGQCAIHSWHWSIGTCAFR